ncbi:MAG TPA: FG-GAP-like repeat-containing protein [Candidatus Sulfotelmatobacter sp.]|nr:FG-GAP-like repeat-containing protein [Candidatus Sulfotelmatobacter sp.]
MRLAATRWRAYSCVSFLILLASISSASAQTYSFGQLYLPTGQQTTSIASGDFNGDGIPDLVVANLGENTVSVFMGSPDFGAFEGKADFATGLQPYSVAVGDFNGDGNLDIVVTNENCTVIAHVSTVTCSAGSVSVLLGNGDGTFQPHVDYATGLAPISVTATDLNGDGKLDLVVANNQDHSISILLGNGDGTFVTHVDYSVPSPTVAIVGDFNHDGKPDVAASTVGGFSVWLGNGDGTLQTRADFPLQDQSAASSLVAADFNHDGNQDLAVSGSSVGVSIFLGNGDGTFTFKATYPAASGTVIAADVNGDGKIDLAVLDTSSLSHNPSFGFAVLLGNGDGTFQSAVDIASGGLPSNLVAGDFNGDGHLDLAISNDPCFTAGPNFADTSCGPSSVTVLLGNGQGVFGTTAQNAGAVGTDPTSLLQVDLNGDQKLDFVVLNHANETISVLLGNGDGTFAPQVTYATGHMPVALQAADFKGDGKIGVAVVNQICVITSTTCAAGSVSVLLGNGDGTLQPHVDFAVGVTPVGLAIADFNGDGKPDLAVTNANLGLGNTVSILTGKGDGTFNPHVDYTVVNEPGPIVAADFNNDGKIDLAIACEDTANTQVCPSPLSVSILLGNGDATFQRHDLQLATSGFSGGPSSLVAADLNADSISDLIAGQLTGGGFSAFLGKGDGTFQPAGAGAGTGVGKDYLAVGDLYGDHKVDVALAEETPRVVVFHGNGDGTFQSAQGLMPPADATFSDPVLLSADFNGDGGLDLAVLQPGSAKLSIFLNQPFKALSRTSLNFRSQGVSTTSEPLSVNISNPSGAPFSITNIAVSGAPFSQINLCITRLLPGQSCTINVTFAPTAAGTSNGSLTITDTASVAPQVIPLTGMGVNGPFVQLSSGAVGFAATAVGLQSQDQRISFENTGNTPLSVSSIAVTGGDSGDFIVTGDPCTSVAAGAQCSRTMAFMPTAAGLRSASLVITDNAPGSPHIVKLLGTGLGSGVTLAPSSLTFASQSVGTTSAAQVVTLTNTSTLGVFITQIAASGDFKQTNNCGGALNAMATCQVSITFTPTAGGARTGTLTVAAGAGSPLTQTAVLTGTGADFSISGGSSGSGGSATVTAGATATYPISLVGGAGFSGTVALTCSGAPANSTCSISPSSLAAAGVTPALATVSVTTTARSALFVPNRDQPENMPWRMFLVLATLLIAFLSASALAGTRSLGNRRLAFATSITALLLIVGATLNGCGGGSSNPSSPTTPTGGTAAGSYTITVTATAGTGGNAVSHTIKLALTVQ